MINNTHVFGIGWPRSGTTTLKAAVKMLGFPQGNTHIGDQQLREYDLYRKQDCQYKDAKFIYTKRESPEKWLASVNARTKVIEGNEVILNNRQRMYGSREVIPEIYLPRYMKREVDVIDYFQSKYKDRWSDRLLVICWEENTGEENWRLLCEFLGEPIPHGETFPHKNKSKR